MHLIDRRHVIPYRGSCHDSAGNHFDFTANHLKTNDFGKKDFPGNHEDFTENPYIRKSGDDVSSLVSSKFSFNKNMALLSTNQANFDGF
jgi:hypothetical protein